MAIKKPLVLMSGELAQIQSGDNINTPVTQLVTNGEASPIVIGQPVYVFSANTVKLARANNANQKKILGLVADTSIAAAASGYVQTNGLLTATTAEWDAVTGQVGGLTPQTTYYLDAANAGKLVTTPPSGSGEYVAPVGQAVSSTDFEIKIGTTIRL